MLIGGNRAWKVYRYRDIGVSLQWVDGDPAMILFPLSGDKRSAYVLPLQSLHEICIEGDKVDGRAVIEKGMIAADVMGRLDKATAVTCADAILRFAPDLLRMPPEPDPERPPAVGEVEVKADGQTIYEGEI
jgi:hypothetical protein